MRQIPTTSSLDAQTDASIAAQLSRAQDLTLHAARILGLADADAARAAAEGAIVLDDALVTVAPLPLIQATGEPHAAALMVSMDTGLRLQSLDRRTTSALLGHAPGLLAVFDAAIGCQPDGAITLHRVLKGAPSASAADLAQCMLAMRQMVHLLGRHDDDRRSQ